MANNTKTTAKSAKTKPTVRSEKYIVDVCNGGCYALFPDGTLRAFMDQTECQTAIAAYAKRSTGKSEILVSTITWNYRDRTVTETVRVQPKS